MVTSLDPQGNNLATRSSRPWVSWACRDMPSVRLSRRKLALPFGSPPAPSRSLCLQEIGNLEQDELVVVGLVRLAARRERQGIVVADHDMALVDDIDVLDGEERERQNALVERLARHFAGVLDLHQIDVGDLAHRLADIGVRELDLVDALELGNV